MKIKATRRYCFIPVKAIIKKRKATNADKDEEQ
jgi:hypothetical protein